MFCLSNLLEISMDRDGFGQSENCCPRTPAGGESGNYERSVIKMTSKFVLSKSCVHWINNVENFIHTGFVLYKILKEMICRFQFCECCKSQKIRVDDVMFSVDTSFHFNGYVNDHKTVSRVQHNPYVAFDARGQTTVKHSLGTRSWKEDGTPKDISICWMMSRKRKWMNCHSQLIPILLSAG
jgi:hypothetical protein